MSTVENAISASHLRGEYCSLTIIEGVKRLTTSDGLDIVNICTGLHEQLTTMTKVLSDCQERLKKLESEGTGKGGKDGRDGRDGLDGKDGRDGRDGKNAPNKFRDLVDVDASGLCDGAIFIYKKSEDKFVAGVVE